MNIEIFLETFIIYSQKDLSSYKDPNTPNPRHPLLLTDLKKDVIITEDIRVMTMNLYSKEHIIICKCH